MVESFTSLQFIIFQQGENKNNEQPKYGNCFRQ